MRYNPDAVGDIGEVTSPPYDVMDRPMIEQLLAEHARNIVRLVLPRMVSDPMNDVDPYVRAAHLLGRWRAKGILTTDAAPGLYVYQYGDDQHSVCGLVGALELRDQDEQVVLPHEDVIEAIVADRLAMMTAAESNLEPILLVYDGAGANARWIDEAREQPPAIDVRAADGTYHRLWQITEPTVLAAIAANLEQHQALIADGHHRYATYLRLRDRLSGPDRAPGPWDRGLALLIDQSQCPLQVGAIHRSVADASLASLSAPPGFTAGPVQPVDSITPPAEHGVIVLTDGLSRQELRWQPDEAVSDAEVLHGTLLPAWGVDDDRVGYHHTIGQTVRNAQQESGVAILMHPATVGAVMAVARAGKVMPRKSTSFGPKPRTGLVMRSFADDA